MNIKLFRAVHFRGIHADSLGGYLMGLGLLSACAKRWPDIRGCWRDRHFTLLHTNLDPSEIRDFLLNFWNLIQYPIGKESAKGTPKTFWTNEQKADTKAGASRNIQKMRSKCTLDELKFLDSHLVSIKKNVFNPVFGTGGNIGRRSLAKVSLDAKILLDKAAPQDKGSWLDHTLFGEETNLPELQSTGTWFVQANKTYNSGQNDFYREGRLSPWSFLLALEGGIMLTGAVERRLTTRARPYAVFPFITEPASPIGEGSVGLKREGEFWAPLWWQPASIIEVQCLLRRGLARLGDRNATAPHEFGAAALGKGVDAGISAFAPFELRETTSSQVFEAVPCNLVPVSQNIRNHIASELVTELIPWVERLPFEDSNSKGKFSGLRGPVEQAIRAITERPSDPACWQSLLLQLSDVQKRIDQDRTRDWRKTCIALPRLSINWLNYLWPDQMSSEAKIACSIASVGAWSDSPLLVNIFGVEIGKNGAPYLPKDRPFRVAWGQGPLIDQLIKILLRRLIDANKEDPWPLECTYPATISLVGDFLDGALDEEAISRWLPALSLLDWRQHLNNDTSGIEESMNGIQLLDGFFRPFFTSGLKWDDNEDTAEPDLLFGLRLANILQQDDTGNAIELSISRIRALGRVPSARPIPLDSCGPRLAAAFLAPLSLKDVYAARDKWLLPAKNK